jgi:hypothetical protein
VQPGPYAFVVRLGDKDSYHYGRTDDFELSASQKVTVTIGHVGVDGEAVRDSSAAEFDAAR